MTRKVDLVHHFPIPPGGLRDDCIVNADMDVTAGFELQLPQLFTLDDEGYAGLHTALTHLIKRQPVGTTFHFQDFRYRQPFQHAYHGESLVQRENFKRFLDRPVLRGHTHLYVTYSNRPLRKIHALQSSLMRTLQYSVTQPHRDFTQVIQTYRKFLGPIQSDLNLTEKIHARRLTTEQLRAAVGNYFGLRYADPLDENTAPDFVLPDYEITDGYLRIGNQFVVVLSLTQEGPQLLSSAPSKHLPRDTSGIRTPQTTKLPTSLVYPLTLGLPFDHIFNLSIEVLDNPLAKSIVGGGHAIGTNILSGFMEEAKQKRAETSAFLETITKYHYQACRVTCNLILHDASMSALAEKTSYAINASAGMNDSRLYHENKESANLFFCSSPGYIRANHRTFLETVEQAVCYIPKESLYSSDPEGIVFTTPFGEPVTVNFFNAPDLDNRNGVLFGPSGTGKSVLLNYMADQFLAAGCTVYTVDVGASYYRNCAVNQGLYLDSKDVRNFSFNPFLCPQDTAGNYLFEPEDSDALIKNYVINHVYSNLAAIVKTEITPQAKGLLKKCIRAYFLAVNQRKLFPHLAGFFDFTRHFEQEMLEPEYKGFVDFNSIRLLLEPFALGEYKHILNGPRNERTGTNRYTVTELKSVVDDEDLREVVFLNVLHQITQLIAQKNFRYFFAILDEVIDYLKGDFGDSIGGFFRKIRKEGGGVIVATQGIDYLDKIDPLVKASILSNCDIKLLTNHSKYRNLYPSLRRDLSLTNVDFQLLDSLEKDADSREVFMKFGSTSRKYRVELSPYAYALYNTNAQDMKEIYAMEKEYGSIHTAVNQFLENRKQ